jgi:uncharacterized protein (TIGR02598 family)
MKFLGPSKTLVRLLTSRRAFSLAETTMAVAIAALGIVSIMGLMPQGLETSRRTSNIAVQTRIVQEIVGDLQSMDWATLDTTVSSQPLRNYDDQGIRLNGSGFISYVAHIELKTDTSPLPQKAGGSGGQQSYMRRLVIKIASTTRSTFDFSPANADHYKTISYILSKIQ